MKTRPTILGFFLTMSLFLTACEKAFLDKKPSSNIVQPQTLAELEELMENVNPINRITSALPQLSADEYYFINQEEWEGIYTQIERLAYVWTKDIYGGEANIPDWNKPYSAVFYANNVLKQLDLIDRADNPVKYDNIKGWALFVRAFAFFDLANNFAPVYDGKTAEHDLGIPLKLSPNIDEIVNRSTVAETYHQILTDLKQAAELLNENHFRTNQNRASKPAALAMLARVYLNMRDYENAEFYANKCLQFYDVIKDFNDVDKTSQTPFSYTTNEIIYYSTQVSAYAGTTTYLKKAAIGVDTVLLSLYKAEDLRRVVYFFTNSVGHVNMKRGFIGSGSYPFTGLAVGEICLIKAECLARRGKKEDALTALDQLLIKRYKSGSFNPTVASSSEDALRIILQERRKELVWRGRRWEDLRRLNKEGANIMLKRKIGGHEYILPPNDSRYVFPIPEDEIALSGIKQNLR